MFCKADYSRLHLLWDSTDVARALAGTLQRQNLGVNFLQRAEFAGIWKGADRLGRRRDRAKRENIRRRAGTACPWQEESGSLSIINGHNVQLTAATEIDCLGKSCPSDAQ